MMMVHHAVVVNVHCHAEMLSINHNKSFTVEINDCEKCFTGCNEIIGEEINLKR